MPHNDFDELLRDRLRDYESPVNPESWTRIRAGWAFDRTIRASRWLVAVVVIGSLILLTAPIELSDSSVNHSNIGAAFGSQPDGIAGAGHSDSNISQFHPAGSDSPHLHTGPAATGYANPRFPGANRRNSDASNPDPSDLPNTPVATTPAEIATPTAPSTAAAATPAATATSASPRQLVPVNLAAIRRSPYAVVAGPPTRRELKCPIVPIIGHKVYVDLFVSPDFINGHFNGSATAGAHITIYLSKKFFVTTGIQYSRIHRPPTGNDSLNFFLATTFHNLDLPLLAGYTVSTGLNTISFTGGAIINLYSQPASPALRTLWPAHIGPGAWLGVDIAHRFNDHFSFFAQPYGRYLFYENPMFFPNHTFTEGVLLGIRYEFIRR